MGFLEQPVYSRPTKLPDNLVEKYLDAICKIVYEAFSPIREHEVEEIAKHIQQHLDSGNGYEIARGLERKYLIDPDSHVVECLDNVRWEKRILIEEAVKYWVAQEHIEPKFKLGDTVEIYYNKSFYKGTIVNIYADIANYTVNVPELGHMDLNNINDIKATGTIGVLLPFEEVRDAKEKETRTNN